MPYGPFYGRFMIIERISQLRGKFPFSNGALAMRAFGESFSANRKKWNPENVKVLPKLGNFLGLLRMTIVAMRTGQLY